MRSYWYEASFKYRESSRHRFLSIDSNNYFYVPLRGDGVGTLRIGSGNSFGWWRAPRLGSGEILIQARSARTIVTIGDQNAFSNNVSIVANEKIEIGNNCQIGDFVAIYDCDFHEIEPTTRNRSAGPTNPVIIGNNVWFGSRVLVLKGATIGDNSVIAAASVVTKSIPANCIAAGNPARVIRSI